MEADPESWVIGAKSDERIVIGWSSTVPPFKA